MDWRGVPGPHSTVVAKARQGPCRLGSKVPEKVLGKPTLQDMFGGAASIVKQASSCIIGGVLGARQDGVSRKDDTM